RLESPTIAPACPSRRSVGIGIVLNITSLPDQADKAADPRYINMSDLGEDERAEWQRPRDFLPAAY
ncbi:MAG: hypothetical protein ACKPKO_15465, partial [Candidatus Fonsibacter sp.]